MEFEIRDYVFLMVSPTKGIYQLKIKGKLSPRYVEPFEIWERVGSVAYGLVLSRTLANVHNVFHVSMLQKYISNPNKIVEMKLLLLEKDLTYEEHSVKILDNYNKKLRNQNL